VTTTASLGQRLRLMSMGGEQVLPASVARWFERVSVPLMNIYGPTEATVNMTTHRISRAAAVVPIGRPVANTEVMVVDGTGRPLPAGAPGELWVAGVCVARGYLNRPELTAERFVGSPWSVHPDSRFYRTGDLVRWLPDGTMEFLGRIDRQIKLRGFRIEPAEIESTLLTHPDVTAAVVELRDDPRGGKRLVAYCVTAPGKSLVDRDLRDLCARVLPDHMVPAVVVFLERLPVTINGKAVDRAALPEPSDQYTAQHEEHVAPRTRAERTLTDIFAEVLDRDRVGIDDHFFELGGNSFLSIQVILAAKKAGISLTPRMIFQHPTVAELAPLVQKVDANVADSVDPGNGPSRFSVIGTAQGHLDNRVAAVRLNRSDANRTVFCLHEGGGNVAGYAHLAEALSDAAKVIGIEARSVGFGAEPDGDVREMAASYWSAIRDIQPTGPYVLAGWSFGGSLALEIAHLAEQSDAHVTLIVALDSCLPIEEARPMIEHDHQAVAALLGALSEGDVGSADLKALLGQVGLPDSMLELPQSELLLHARTLEAHLRAVLHFCPPQVVCPVELYQAQESPWAVPLVGSWRPFTQDVRSTLVPGGHHTFLRPPHAQALARRIASAIEAAESRGH
ncbi:MAG: alpha/beta fold hydrolase, partial [Pseudonocardiaceae bacterium]